MLVIDPNAGDPVHPNAKKGQARPTNPHALSKTLLGFFNLYIWGGVECMHRAVMQKELLFLAKQIF